jgi:hypothetical protein
MKNKPDLALLRPSNLSNEMKKMVPKSRETIPLMLFQMSRLNTVFFISIFIDQSLLIALRSCVISDAAWAPGKNLRLWRLRRIQFRRLRLRLRLQPYFVENQRFSKGKELTKGFFDFQ